MGFKLINVGNTPNVPYEEWVCDTLQDFEDYVENRNSPPGSTCYIISNDEGIGERRIKKVEGKWEKYSEGSGESYDDTELRNRITTLEEEKADKLSLDEVINLLYELGYFEETPPAYAEIIEDGELKTVLLTDENNNVLTVPGGEQDE